jgi:4'-phosphopantetheinyl transferase
LFQKHLSQMDPAKKARISRYVNKKDAWRSLLADMLLRKVLFERFNLRREGLVVRTNEFGKPYLLNREDIFFNLTHSGDWVGCIVGNVSVGIDIEHVHPIELSLAKSCFSTREYLELLTLPEKDRLDYFYELWTLKESYIKAVGKGLYLPLQLFTVLEVKRDKLISVEGQDEGFYCRTYFLEEGYKMSCCSFGTLFPNEIEFVRFSSMM